MKQLQNHTLQKKFFFSAPDEHLITTGNIHSEEGFVLLTSMMIMIAVALLGIAATNTSMFEMQIAGNERWSQDQFFQADSGVNTVLANSRTGEPGRPTPQAVAPPLPTCTNPQGHVPYYSHASIPSVTFYYVGKVSDTPYLAEILVCAARGNSVSSVTAGIEFGLGPGGIPEPGGLEY